MTTICSYPQRTFKLWEYKVSHGSLLIRSPKGPEATLNVDILCFSLEYLAAPTRMRGLDLLEPSDEDLLRLAGALGKEVSASRARVILSEGRRLPIVAGRFVVSENDDEIFSSPFT
jgi:hypothetical protein